jgi:NifU-like protein
MSKASILPQVRDNFKIDSLVNRPQNIGEITEDEAKELGAKVFMFSYGSCEGGLKLDIFWALNQEGRVVDCKIKVFGESEMLAVASIAGLISKNKTPDEILALKEKGLEYFLRENPNTPAFPKSLRFLSNVMIDALYMCAKAYKGEEIESEVADKFTGVTKEFIKDSIKRFEIKELEDLVDLTRAGAYDTSCKFPGAGENLSSVYLVDILKDTLNEIEQAKKGNATIADKPFEQMNEDEKRAAIEATIDKHIRHMLVMDGGDMEILDIKENGENTDIYIRYLGACNGCASASTGTLFAIEGILKQKLSDKIRVVPL